MYNERRNNPRFKYAVDVTYMMDNGDEVKVGRLKNISQHGATLQGDCPLTPKQQLLLALASHGEEYITAEVVWCQIDPEIIDGKHSIRKFNCGLKYKETINEKVTEILKEIESRD